MYEEAATTQQELIHALFGDEGTSLGVECGELELKAESSRVERYNSMTSSLTRIDEEGSETKVGITQEESSGGIQISRTNCFQVPQLDAFKTTFSLSYLPCG